MTDVPEKHPVEQERGAPAPETPRPGVSVKRFVAVAGAMFLMAMSAAGPAAIPSIFR
ncbi:MAG TPA: hypothetical protein VGH76_12365 [Actinomycetospora sp.]|jgi:hypothetical protein|uniref:hypothetical protein n=1 Tax=Actinomycetospora sp. TaxID=1872135 RepID=UPI002F3ED9B6